MFLRPFVHVVNPRRACAARVTVVGSVCVCVRHPNLTYRPTNDTIYLTAMKVRTIVPFSLKVLRCRARVIPV